MDKDTFTLQSIRQDLIDNNLQAKAIIQARAYRNYKKQINNLSPNWCNYYRTF